MKKERGSNMESKNDVEVLINGKRYTICGFESEDYLQKVATYINSKYTEFKQQDYYYNLDLDLRNILLAINIADDYFKIKKENEALMRDSERKDQMVLDMKHEVLDAQSKSDDVVSRKDELKGQLDDAEKKIVELNIKNEDNTSKVASLEEKLAEAQTENSSHASKLETALAQVKKLESENSRLKKRNETLNDRVKTLGGKSDDPDTVVREKYEKENAELQAKLAAAERRITDLESRNRRKK